MNRTLICFSNIDWDFLYQRHQNLMNLLAERKVFNKIIFVENLGIRNLKLKDFERVMKRIKTSNKDISKNPKNENIEILSPFFLPYHSQSTYILNKKLIKKQLAKLINLKGSDEELYIWNFSSHPVVKELINEIDYRLNIFDCIDDLKSFKDVHPNVLKTEQELIRNADMVIATSKKLLEYTKELNYNSHLIRNGVNFKHFSENINNNLLDKLKAEYQGEIIGYFGAIYEWFDLELIEEIAQKFNNDILIIGPVRLNIDHLKRYKNLHFIGAVDFTELPTYLQLFSVGIIPFVNNELIQNTNPVKMYEYFTAGMPVVSIEMPELLEFSELVYLSASHNEFIGNIVKALNEEDITLVEKRRDISFKNTWDERVDYLIDHLKI